MYAMTNDPERMARILKNCDLLHLAEDGSKIGAMKISGDDLEFPNIILIYETSEPTLTDLYRLFCIHSVKFLWQEIK